MSHFFLRVEAVNLCSLIDDTEDLSTIRGSGLAILYLEDRIRPFVEGFAKVGPKSNSIQTVTQGASQLVFEIKDLGCDPTELCVHVRTHLRKDDLLRFATIMVEHSASEYSACREELLAEVRFSQLSSLSLSPAGCLDAAHTDRSNKPWCDVDFVRPASEENEAIRSAKKDVVSTSVAKRREFGFQQKQTFYRNKFGWLSESSSDQNTAWHFHQIALSLIHI